MSVCTASNHRLAVWEIVSVKYKGNIASYSLPQNTLYNTSMAERARGRRGGWIMKSNKKMNQEDGRIEKSDTN